MPDRLQRASAASVARRRFRISRLLFLGLAPAIVLAFADGSARAGCTVGAEIDCVDPIAPGEANFTDADGTTLDVSTSTVIDGISLTSTATGDGNAGSDLHVIFTGGGITQAGVGVLANSTGSKGDGGGDGGAFVDADDGHVGGAGGAVTVDASGAIITTGDKGHGIVAVSAGGNGGNGGNCYVATGCSPGDGGQGGPAGHVTVNLNGGSIHTDGTGADGIFAESVGGGGGASGDCDFGICGGSGGGDSAAGGQVDVKLVPGTTVETVGDTSHAVYAGSIGGFAGGGSDAYVGLNFGADAGSAGPGGQVTVTNDGALITHGVASFGIMAQSIGGGGGDGGDTFGLVGVGSGGSGGGKGGNVFVDNHGTIDTYGEAGKGIFAQSVGGSGGSGGYGGGLLGIGGDGSTTSDGGQVTVTNTNRVETRGNDAEAIFAQSIGGGGGNGGDSVGLVSLGGSGGGGGAGDTVAVNNSGSLTTHGDDSHGIFAESIGGGGGNGGMAVAVPTPLNAVSLAIGGSADNGGPAGSVLVNFTSDINLLTTTAISTGGDRANGIEAQSVGGGGGNGGSAFALSGVAAFTASISLGGNGGNGGDGAAVVVNQKGTITTAKSAASGIFAQSVGGGGGNGGNTISAGVNPTGYAINLAMGGSSGGGGSASAVNVALMGSITTHGDQSFGILAQSVGGGGGNGGFAVAVGVGSAAASLAIGGSGGSGGAGDHVTVDVYALDASTHTIETFGAGADAILAQSIGGGGGNGGIAGALTIALPTSGPAVGAAITLGGGGGGGGNGGVVDVNNHDALITHGEAAVGLLAQSVGGGGGNGGFALSAAGGVASLAGATGGDGGGAGNGAAVHVNNYGDITTSGGASFGILAQSVGGGGGNGGSSIAGSLGVQLADIPGAAISISLGGKAGGGGDGGTVNVDNEAGIETFGLGSHALFAQSVGGGGGNGGFAGSLSVTAGTGLAVGIDVGGKGGAGGSADAVTVSSAAGHAIVTHADGSDGIHAQSIGGGGGDGGFVLSATVGTRVEINPNLSVALGGDGGGGGDGSTVDVHNHSSISTLGAHSNGIFAQSVGGGGGSGGMAAAGGIGFGSSPNQFSIAIGGNGGNADIGGAVSVDNDNLISTAGDYSVGILAQSIGGGGGAGGMGLTAQLSAATNSSGNIRATLGGTGGSGNAGGTVTVTNNAGGKIHTTGMFADGIFAQSVGGGGGSGGMAVSDVIGLGGEETNFSAGAALGGDGAVGGIGDTVRVTNHDTIETEGDASAGIFAQSVGGGGGNAGDALTNAMGITNTGADNQRNLQVTVALGGTGGGANHGGEVHVDNSGGITTQGASSYGIFAQSVGGGGGIGGRANTVNILFGSACTLPIVCTDPNNVKNNWTLGVNVGGDGGAGSNGGLVDVDNSGNIETFGDAATGIVAQSVGGGGGMGGNGHVGTGEILPVPAELATIPVSQVKTYKNISITVGGKGNASGDGGTVDVTNSGNVTTHGDDASGIFAQSVGGGGGVGGLADIGATGTIGIGGSGGAGGAGATVTVDQNGGGKIETFGVASMGIFAQSVGGGGGVAGNVDRALAHGAGPIPALNLGIGLALGQGGGAGGNGDAVEVNLNDGTIVTHGDSAAGIFAQSVGGGGGVLGSLGNDAPVLNLLDWYIGSVGDAGNGGAVTVTLGATGPASIYTSGNSATGILAQSVGGAGTGGAVTVTLNSTVDTGAVLAEGDELRGQGSIGILAQSVGQGGNGNIVIDLASPDGLVRGGRGDSAVGVWIMDGATNTLTNRGTVTVRDGVLDGYAILATGSDSSISQNGGNEAVDNLGTVTGSFDLGAGTNSFTNEVDAVLNSGRFAHVGDLVGGENLLLNRGTVSPGGTGVVMTTEVLGNWTQNATGHYAIDLDFFQFDADGNPIAGKAADRVNAVGTGADGGTISLAGDAVLGLVNAGNAMPGDHTVTIAHADVALLTTSFTLDAPASAVATYALNQPDSQTLDLQYSVTFAPSGLNENEQALGEQLNAIQLGFPRPPASGADPDTPLAPLIDALLNLPDIDSLKAAYDQLVPAVYTETQVSTTFANTAFDDMLQSCKSRDGDYKFVREGECAWLSVDGRKLERDTTDSNSGFDQWATSVAGGVQAALSDNWRLGGGLSYEGSSLTTDTDAETFGDTVQAGLVLKGRYAGTTLSTTVSGGYAQYDTERTVSFPGIDERVSGTQRAGFASAHGRLSQLVGGDRAYLRPSIDGGVMYYRSDNFDESGSTLVGVSVEGSERTYFALSPALEIGGEFGSATSTLVRPFVQAGITQYFGEVSPVVEATLEGAPDGVAPFETVDDFDRTFVNVSGGLTMLSTGGIVAKLSGSWSGSENFQQFGGGLKVSVPLQRPHH